MMTRKGWLAKIFGDRARRQGPRHNKVRGGKSLAKPFLELLEDRLTPAAGLTGSNQQLLDAYGQLPLSFEVNNGQTNSEVQYLSRGSGYALFLTSSGSVLSLEERVGEADSPSSPPAGVTGVAL